MLSLPLIPTTSPSLADAMRGCMLRAGLSRCAQLQPFVLANPKAWLGTAYHKVMEQLPAILSAAGDPLAAANAIWNAEVSRLERQAANHPLNSRMVASSAVSSSSISAVRSRLGMNSSLKTVFPDLNYHFKVIGAEGDVVKTTSQLSGTHSGSFDLTGMNMGVIPATDKTFSTKLEKTKVTVRENKITSWAVEQTEGAGLKAILGQLDVKPTAM